MMAHRVANSRLARFRTADLSIMGDDAANAFLNMGANHGFQHVTRITGNFGREHFFRSDVFRYFTNRSLR